MIIDTEGGSNIIYDTEVASSERIITELLVAR